ncbi:MAG: LPS export ABC transporter ATP-binding protein [Fimbriiglobus sp.]|nr:LPS export ABC transporter ATP-binding protein [Fimbriiglobus sp.]
MPLLEAHGLEKWYGPRKVVDGVSFEVNPGEVVGLLGPNGAGKTTSFRMTTGQITPNGGRVRFADEDVTTLPMFKRARRGMGYLSQEPSIFRKLTVEQNLLAILEALPKSRTLNRRLTADERHVRTEAALKRFNLLEVRNNIAARCSGGEKRRLEIARCLVCEPLLILLDEPLAAVDPLTKEDIRHNVRDLANQGIGILLTDHDVREVLKIADRAYLIIGGKVVAHGTPEELKRNKVAVEGYLGSTFDDEIAYGRLKAEPRRNVATAIATTTLETDEVVSLASANTAPEPLAPLLPVSSATATPAPNATPGPVRMSFGGSTGQLLEQEKMRRWVEQLRDRETMPGAWHELTSRGRDAVPVLLEALERRELELRHLAHRVLESVTGEQLAFNADAPDEVRLKQIAHLRVKLENR